MKLVPFREWEATYTADKCENLPVYTPYDEKIEAVGINSCWEFEKEDIERMLRQVEEGEMPKIYLCCLGGQPPVWRLCCGSPLNLL